ncbi:MAG: VCBS repeat-containing protein, partial [Anaerolineae bacterium]|nr:VCBS repeat-containing protein [Anaerolineae bacterium]
MVRWTGERSLHDYLKLVLVCGLLFAGLRPGAAISAPSSVQAPVLKWQHGGCYSSWCETGWYASPAVADLDSDGTMEVIASAYSVVILDGASGSLEKRIDHDGSRAWPGVVVADLEGDGDLEIVTAHGGGYINRMDHTGTVDWTMRPATNEFRSLAVGDLDASGDLEIVVGRALLNRLNVWVLEDGGATRPGWPQLTGEGSAAGIYNDNIALGDLDGDPELELVIPSDTITIAAYEPDGSQLGTDEMYHDHSGHDMDYWAEVPAYIDLAYETQGWGPCYEQSTARANFADGPANIVDVNGDGVNEVVAIGNVHDCHTSPYTNLYNTPYILNLNRTRFNADGFDWTTPPVNTGVPLIEDYNVIESVQPNPVTVDLDGDGKLEIIFASYDGRLHAFWLDKTEHGSWPYAVHTGGPYRFASEPVVADLDADGHPEVIFGSWVQKGTGATGKLHILDYLGHPLHEVDLPFAYGSPDWNGALAAPTLANIDDDGDLEVVLNTAHSGFVAYDLPGTADARILWGTGRGSYLRNGTPGGKPGSLAGSTKSVNNLTPAPGDSLTYTIALNNPGAALASAMLTDTLPSGLAFAGNLWASSGLASQNGGTVTWRGEVPSGAPV